MKKYSLLCVVMYSYSMYGMLVNKKYVNHLQASGNRHFWSIKKINNYGLATATMPQTSKGVLGEFRLDKTYGVRSYLGQYIAHNKKISLEDAHWEDFNAIKKAFQQFLSHNSSIAIQDTLNNNVINKDYAVHALYFTYKVVKELQEHIEYNQDFAHQYAHDPEQYIWVDNDAFKSNRRQLLKDIECEQKSIIDLVDFLQQRPVNKNDTTRLSGGVFDKRESSSWWSFTLPERIGKRPMPHRIAHVHDGVLGAFNFNQEYTIQEYLKKYLDNQDDKVEWRALKKAYDDFLFYNMPSRIRDAFETSEKIKNKKIKMVWSSRPIVENATEKEVEEALLFTRDVTWAMQCYLHLDTTIDDDCTNYNDSDGVCYGSDCFCMGRLSHSNQSKQLKDGDVQLFALLGVEPAKNAQTWEGVLGNFVLSKKQNAKTQCTIQDYLCKYIARNLQIPEDAVPTEATFLDIKKAFEMFVNHNHPDAILRDFGNELITKQYAKNALQFTSWVVNALEEYLANFKDDSYEIELFELFWTINRIKATSHNMRFVEKGEWCSATKE